MYRDIRRGRIRVSSRVRSCPPVSGKGTAREGKRPASETPRLGTPCREPCRTEGAEALCLLSAKEKVSRFEEWQFWIGRIDVLVPCVTSVAVSPIIFPDVRPWLSPRSFSEEFPAAEPQGENLPKNRYATRQADKRAGLPLIIGELHNIPLWTCRMAYHRINKNE